jgi:hypothetical protein
MSPEDSVRTCPLPHHEKEQGQERWEKEGMQDWAISLPSSYTIRDPRLGH